MPGVMTNEAATRVGAPPVYASAPSDCPCPEKNLRSTITTTATTSPPHNSMFPWILAEFATITRGPREQINHDGNTSALLIYRNVFTGHEVWPRRLAAKRGQGTATKRQALDHQIIAAASKTGGDRKPSSSTTHNPNACKPTKHHTHEKRAESTQRGGGEGGLGADLMPWKQCSRHGTENTRGGGKKYHQWARRLTTTKNAPLSHL